MKLWSYWLPDLLPHVAGCPTLIATHELRRTAQAFFHATKAWKLRLATPFAVGAGQRDVTVTFTDQVELERIENVWLDGQRLVPATTIQLSEDYGDDWAGHTGTPSRYYLDTPGVISLYPLPSAAAAVGLVVRAEVSPSDASTGLPDDIAVAYRDAIQIGAKARLMAYKGKPWTDLALAGSYAEAFQAAVTKAKNAASTVNSRGRVASRPSWC